MQGSVTVKELKRIVFGAPEPVRPGLDVSLMVGFTPVPERSGHVALVRLAGGAPPLRVSLYVDGDLVEGWMPAPETCELPLPALGPGRHAVTVRAVDAHGRWGGASAVLASA